MLTRNDNCITKHVLQWAAEETVTQKHPEKRRGERNLWLHASDIADCSSWQNNNGTLLLQVLIWISQHQQSPGNFSMKYGTKKTKNPQATTSNYHKLWKKLSATLLNKGVDDTALLMDYSSTNSNFSLKCSPDINSNTKLLTLIYFLTGQCHCNVGTKWSQPMTEKTVWIEMLHTCTVSC